MTESADGSQVFEDLESIAEARGYDGDEDDLYGPLFPHAHLYPAEPILTELGRIVVASSRLDFFAFRLWRSMDVMSTASALLATQGLKRERLVNRMRRGGKDAIDAITVLASDPSVIHPEWRDEVLGLISGAQEADQIARSVLSAQQGRNTEVHSVWVLDDVAQVPHEDVRDDAWQRTSVDGEWWWVHNLEDHAVRPPTLERLREVEQGCRRAAQTLLSLTHGLGHTRFRRGSKIVTVGGDTLVDRDWNDDVRT